MNAVIEVARSRQPARHCIWQRTEERLSTLYGVNCPYCQKKAYVHVPDTPPFDKDREVEVTEESVCNNCGQIVVAYTRSSADWGVRIKEGEK